MLSIRKAKDMGGLNIERQVVEGTYLEFVVLAKLACIQWEGTQLTLSRPS